MCTRRNDAGRASAKRLIVKAREFAWSEDGYAASAVRDGFSRNKPRKIGGNRAPVAMGFVDDAADYLPPQTFILAAINYPSTGVVEYCAIRWVTDALPLGRAPRATVRRRIEGADMLAWLLWRLERMERIRVVASALMREFGDEAYTEARRREREADWGRNGRETGVGSRWSSPAGRARMVQSANRRRSSRKSRGRSGFNLFAERSISGPTNLTEKQIEVADAPAAIIAAANIKWPPQTIGVRILDREGHEVFARQKAQRRLIPQRG